MKKLLLVLSACGTDVVATEDCNSLGAMIEMETPTPCTVSTANVFVQTDGVPRHLCGHECIVLLRLRRCDARSMTSGSGGEAPRSIATIAHRHDCGIG